MKMGTLHRRMRYFKNIIMFQNRKAKTMIFF